VNRLQLSGFSFEPSASPRPPGAWWKTTCAVFLVCAATGIGSSAQTLTSLYSFDGLDGANPQALIQGIDGNFYGTAANGAAEAACLNCGTVFKITPAGTLTTLYSFCAQANCTDGLNPAGLVLAANGDFYGTTGRGGKYNWGTVFEITPAGTLTTLYSFCAYANCADGATPVGLILANNGDFYGMTAQGGASGAGTVFKITPIGTLTTLYSFCVNTNCADGKFPAGALVQATNGSFYGTTVYGGQRGDGTVFKITPTGSLTTLHSFDGTDGMEPQAGLVQAADGDFYGTAFGGPNAAGTVFKITPMGALTRLYAFCSQAHCTDGDDPYAPLVQATNGDLYGTTYGGGINGEGSVFQITPQGSLTTLYSFSGTDGDGPVASLAQATSGIFYGSTELGGTSAFCRGGCGTVFSLSVGLGPFVETLPSSGTAGATVKVLGTNLTGATSVTFNGTPATFTVRSPSLISAAVPAGATTGTVQVVTPSGTLSSNVPFQVAP
jgi:uncharacterized repeat protein (TIGR03803 family)